MIYFAIRHGVGGNEEAGGSVERGGRWFMAVAFAPRFQAISKSQPCI